MNFFQICRAPANVLIVDGGRCVGEVFHGFALGYAGPGHAARGRDAQGMETSVRKAFANADAFKEVPPCTLAIHFGVGLYGAGSLQFPEKRAQAWMERFGGALTSFLAESDESALQVDVGHGVEPGFVESDAVPAGNEEAVSQHCASGLGFEFDGLGDALKVFIGEFGTNGALSAFEAKFPNWISWDEIAPDGFLDDDAKDFEFQKGGIAPGAVFALLAIRDLAPYRIGEAVGPGKLQWAINMALFKKQADGAPGGQIAFAGAIVGIFGLQEVINPKAPGVFSAPATSLSLIEGVLGFNFSGLSRSSGQGVPTTGALTIDRTRMHVSEFNPPERITDALKQAGHGVPKCAQAVKTCQNQSWCGVVWCGVVRLKLSRGFESPSLRHFITKHLGIKCALGVSFNRSDCAKLSIKCTIWLHDFGEKRQMHSQLNHPAESRAGDSEKFKGISLNPNESKEFMHSCQ